MKRVRIDRGHPDTQNPATTLTYQVYPLLLPSIRTNWDVQGQTARIKLEVDELILANPSDTVVADTRLVMPEITESGLICGFKNTALANPTKLITIEPFFPTDNFIGIPSLMSGINLLISAVQGAGACLIFLSHINHLNNNDKYWILISNLQGV